MVLARERKVPLFPNENVLTAILPRQPQARRVINDGKKSRENEGGLAAKCLLRHLEYTLLIDMHHVTTCDRYSMRRKEAVEEWRLEMLQASTCGWTVGAWSDCD